MNTLFLGRKTDAAGQRLHAIEFGDIETLVLRHRHEIVGRFDTVVSIQRGGNYLATLISQLCDIDIAYAHYCRADGTVSLFGAAEIGRRVLLAEDIAGKGYTLQRVRDHLLQQGREVRIFCIVSDEHSRIQPDFCLRVEPGWRQVLPWERTMWAQSWAPERTQQPANTDGWRTAFDLDGVFLPDVPSYLYDSNIDAALRMRRSLEPYPHRVPLWRDGCDIITSRLESDRTETMRWLERHGIRAGRVYMRGGLDESPAEFKKRTCVECGVVEFVESDRQIALAMAKALPHCVVWHYDGHSGALARV